jgi:hypothetical protein
LGFHPEPPSADAAESANSRIDAAASIRILGIELSDDSDRRCNDADFAKTALGPAHSLDHRQCPSSSKLPDERALTTIHLEGAGRRPKLYDESIDILSDKLIPKSSGHLLSRRCTPSQRGAQRHDSQNTHFDCVPRPQGPKRNQKAKSIASKR